MKKYLLLLILLSAIKTQAQFPQFYNTPVNKILTPYNCSKVIKYNNEHYFLISTSIYKFDSGSYSLQLFNHPIYNHDVYDIDVDSLNNLVLFSIYPGIKYTISIYNGSNWQRYNYKAYSNISSNLIIDSLNNYFFSLGKDSIVKFKNGLFISRKINSLSSNETLYNLIPDRNHNCVFVTFRANGNYNLYNIYKWNGSTATPLYSNLKNSLSFQFDQNGNFWRSNSDTIFKQTPSGNIIVYDNNNSPNTGFNYRFAIDKSGTKIWKANYYFDGSKWIKYTPWFQSNFNIQGINDDHLFLISRDSIEEYDDTTKVITYKKIKSNIINPTCIHSLNNFDYLIGSENGIWINSSINYNTQSLLGLVGDTISSIKNINDTILIGSQKGFSLFKIKQDTFYLKSFNRSNGKLPSDTVTSIFIYPPFKSFFIPQTKTIWVGTANGLAKFNSDFSAVQFINTSNSSLPSNKIKKITSSLDDSIIIVVTDSGFSTLYGQSIQNYSMANSGLSHHDIRDVAAYGSIQNYYYIIATMGGGICINNFGNWSVLSKTNGNFISDSINFIDAKRENNFCNFFESMIGIKDTGIQCNIQPKDWSNSGVFPFFYNNKIENFFTYSHIQTTDISTYKFAALSKTQIVYSEGCSEGINDFKIDKTLNGIKVWMTNNKLTIQSENLITGTAFIEVYDLSGKLMFSNQTISNEKIATIELPNLANSIYMIKAIQNNWMGYQKLIYQNNN